MKAFYACTENNIVQCARCQLQMVEEVILRSKIMSTDTYSRCDIILAVEHSTLQHIRSVRIHIHLRFLRIWDR